jgi:hypothetical protein
MVTPIEETEKYNFDPSEVVASLSSDGENTFTNEGRSEQDHSTLRLHTSNISQQTQLQRPSASQTRAQEHRLDDELALRQAERIASVSQNRGNANNLVPTASLSRSKSRPSDAEDEFDVNTNPIHEKNAVWKPPEHPTTNLARLFKRVHESSFLIRYFTYITPVVVILLVPLLLGALVFKSADVGGVYLMWFSVWLETVWLTLWLGRVSLILRVRI